MASRWQFLILLTGVLSVVFLVIFFLLRRRRRQQKARALQLDVLDDDDPLDEAEFEQGAVPRRFRYRELAAATSFFSEKEKLVGEGGSGGSSVYRGYLKDMDIHVAVNRLSNCHNTGRNECLSEVMKICGLRHPNLVPLVGWGHGGGELLLVYELMPNGSLDTHIHNQNNVMPWRLRREVVLGIGSALLYLHQDGKQRVVHRDIKPSNVMLDASFNAKLGDFGLARFIEDNCGYCRGWQSHAALVRNMRYMDPEWILRGTGPTAYDVYSFGIVALEVACARRPIVDATTHLVQWVWWFYGLGRIVDAADARLINSEEVNRAEVERVMVTALWCAHPDRRERPSIGQVLSVLRHEAPLPILPVEMPVAEFMFTGPASPIRNRQ